MGPKGSVFRTDLSGNLLEHQVYTSSGGAYTGLIYALEYDLQGGSLFYGDRNTSSLWRVPLTKTLQSDDGRTKLLDDFFAWSMAYDWTTGFLYWTDDMYVCQLMWIAVLAHSEMILDVGIGEKRR